MLIASLLLAATAANGPLHQRCLNRVYPDTSTVPYADSSVALPLGTVESGTLLTFAACRQTADSSLSVADPNDATVSNDSLEYPRSVDTTFRSRRPRAIEYSEAYHTRLKIHQIGAYAMLPLFIGEYVMGQKLLTSTNRSGGLKSAHSLVAGALGIVFVSNTVTGAWNFWDARKDPSDRARREIHSVLMLASDVGMVATAISAGNAKRSLVDARRHRTIAISTIALTAVGSGMMWLWRK